MAVMDYFGVTTQNQAYKTHEQELKNMQIPLWISIRFPIVISGKHFILKFPINPSELNFIKNSNSETVDIEGLGEVSIPITPKLITFSIKSFFWASRSIIPPRAYVELLEQWQRVKLPATIVITRLNIYMKITCESFKWTFKAGEEDCIYYEMDLKEYRKYDVEVSKHSEQVKEDLRRLRDDAETYRVGKDVADTQVNATGDTKGALSFMNKKVDLNELNVDNLGKPLIPAGENGQLSFEQYSLRDMDNTEALKQMMERAKIYQNSTPQQQRIIEKYGWDYYNKKRNTTFLNFYHNR